ncbi:MAG TPA: right-handed parallel beta-helix repeat-containing protein [Candidatus Hydrogenedentes bacterium]|nr:right-handed parallel beta-helix repeat-containing protein [Candidatus Hydrogenedentota bacterium]HPG68860.1 right-handed parallel beta-helix repeat-containing protein [Candidatus Hydrogenedentota bacterium]
MRTVVASLSLAMLTLCIGGIASGEYYVSPEGADGNPGSAELPFATISRAQQAVRSASAAGGDMVVHLGGGVYALDGPIVFTAKDSGRNGHKVVYKALDGETPVISGGKSVSGWQPDADGRWKAKLDIEDCRQLYVNGTRAQRARGPAPEDMGRYGDLEFIDADAGHTAPGEAMADWRNPEDIEFGYYNSWSHMTCKVKDITKDGSGGVTIAMQQPWFTFASRKEGVRAELPAYIENAFELLDEPGEWYFDRPARTVYYLPRDGEDMTSAQVTVPVLEKLIILRGTLDAPVADIRFEGIAFADATWLEPNRVGHVDVQANFTFAPTNIFTRDGVLVNVHNEYLKSPAHIVLHAAKNIVFERCTFTRLGGAAIDIETGSQDNMVSGCSFFDLSATAIQIGDVLVPDHHPADPRLIVQGNRVVNCYLHDIGVEFEDSVGIFAGYVRNTVIAHNEIARLPYSGISVGWGWGEEDAGGGGYVDIPYRYASPTPAGNNRVEANHIHHVMQRRNDGGGIYTLGNQAGTILRANHIHDTPAENGPGGIYLDEGSSFIEVTGNSVYAVATAMNHNNRVQDRITTCNEHHNFFDLKPDEEGFPNTVSEQAGLEAAYRDLLEE